MQGPPRPIRELESMVDHDIPWRTSSAVTSSIVDLWPDLSQVIHEAERLGWVPTFLLDQKGLRSFDISLGQCISTFPCISVNVASIYCRRLKCPHPWKPVALYRTPCSSCPLEYNVEIHPMSAGGRHRVTCDPRRGTFHFARLRLRLRLRLPRVPLSSRPWQFHTCSHVFQTMFHTIFYNIIYI